jgi:hypothetical protein
MIKGTSAIVLHEPRCSQILLSGAKRRAGRIRRYEAKRRENEPAPAVPWGEFRRSHKASGKIWRNPDGRWFCGRTAALRSSASYLDTTFVARLAFHPAKPSARPCGTFAEVP